jgi:fructose/tagatose bisphosphate aldolase
MDKKSSGYADLLKKRPLNVQALYGETPLGLVSGRDIFEAAKRKKAIILAANVRNPLVLKGVMRAAKRLKGAVLFELAKSESTYCGCTFDNIPDYALKYSEELGHGVIFGLHVDHYAIKSREDLLKSVAHLRDIIGRGWTSVAVDASHCPDWENFCYTRDVAMSIPPYLGLEAEVGEIKGPGEVTTPEEARYFVGGLNAWGVFPDVLAISNGSLHGTYDPSLGQVEGIDLPGTAAVAEAVAPYGVSIAQHGISGTPLDKAARFVEYGINKGNVATLWQNIVFGLKMDPETGNAIIEDGSYVKEPHRGITEDLWASMVSWGDEQGYSRKSGDYKKANKAFHQAIMDLPSGIHARIVDEVEAWAERFIKAFNAEGLAEVVEQVMREREDWNAAPLRAVLERRDAFRRENAPDSGKKEDSQGAFEE